MTANVCKKITAQLTGAIGKQDDVSVQLEALDILSDILSRYIFKSCFFFNNVLPKSFKMFFAGSILDPEFSSQQF